MDDMARRPAPRRSGVRKAVAAQQESAATEEAPAKQDKAQEQPKKAPDKDGGKSR
jgi:hypothetical protein